MTKHTPSPWNCETYDGGSFDVCSSATDHYYVIVSRSRHATRGDEQHANARLIASAPELLEALVAVSELPGFEPSEPYGQLVVSAIAKATGENV